MSQRMAGLHDAVFFVALFATALAMGAALAHALELPNKMGLSREDYFVVQSIYAGWNRLGYLLAVQLAGMLGIVVLYRRQRRVLIPALAAVGCLLAAQAVFWIFTFPSNQATADWTLQPETWESLRRQWEYSHLAGAILQTLAMASRARPRQGQRALRFDLNREAGSGVASRTDQGEAGSAGWT